MTKIRLSTLLSAAFSVATTLAVNPIVMKGNLLYDSVTKERFFIKGVTYDPIPVCVSYWVDVLADDYSNEWLDYEGDLQDIASMGVNSIRLYQIDPFKTHSKFLNYAQSLGLYVIPPLTGSKWGYLDASRPSPDCYTASKDGYGHLGTNLLYNAKAIIKEFSQYANVLMYCVGNELVLNAHETEGNCFPCLKALVRDLHAWQDECSQTMRRVPLMYATQDTGYPARLRIGEYATCAQETAADALDIIGLNTYCYCDADPWNDTAPYWGINADYKSFAAPFVFSEFGCKHFNPDTETYSRSFIQVNQMMTHMQETLSGGLVYEYSMHQGFSAGWGLVTNAASTCTDAGTTRSNDASNLASVYEDESYKQFSNFVGDWTDQDRCHWKPPTSEVHAQPLCPGAEVYATWANPLPPTPPLVDWNLHGDWEHNVPPMDCPAYSLTPLELKENACLLPMQPTQNPSFAPTPLPSHPPTEDPTKAPSFAPTAQPTQAPTKVPNPAPTPQPATPTPLSTATSEGVDSSSGVVGDGGDVGAGSGGTEVGEEVMAARQSSLVILSLLGLIVAGVLVAGGAWAWKKKVCNRQASGGRGDESVLKTGITTLGAEGGAGVVAVEAANPMHNDGDGEEECGPPKKDGAESESKSRRFSSVVGWGISAGDGGHDSVGPKVEGSMSMAPKERSGSSVWRETWNQNMERGSSTGSWQTRSDSTDLDGLSISSAKRPSIEGNNDVSDGGVDFQKRMSSTASEEKTGGMERPSSSLSVSSRSFLSSLETISDTTALEEKTGVMERPSSSLSVSSRSFLSSLETISDTTALDAPSSAGLPPDDALGDDVIDDTQEWVLRSSLLSAVAEAEALKSLSTLDEFDF